MAALPFGTANNIARSLGLVDRPCGDLIEGWGGARRVKLDVGSCSGIGEPRNFIEGVGLGLFTDFLADRGAKDILARIEDTEQQVDTALGMLAERARTASPIEVRMELDGSEVAGRYLLIEALNISHVGPNLFLAPDSVPGDGRLDVVSVAESERERLIAYLHAWRHERSKEALLPTRSVKQLRFGRLTSVHIDDERLAKDELSDTLQVALDAGSVEFLVPLDS
jgi:diacylglycerol kinase family enzyme